MTLVAFQTTVAKIRVPRLRRRLFVRIVARDAPQRPPARLEAAALIHLLDVPGVSQSPIAARRPDEGRLELTQRQAGPVLRRLAAIPFHPRLAAEMALLANVFAQRRRQIARVDDVRAVAAGFQRATHMQFARPVAPLATDGVAEKNRRLVPIGRLRDVLHPVGVARQAFRADRTLETAVQLPETGREIPPLRLRVPGQRRLEQIPVPIDQKRQRMSARSQNVPDDPVHLRDDLSLVVKPPLPMDDLARGPLDPVVKPIRLEDVPDCAVAGFGPRRVDGGERSSHRMIGKRRRDLLMAAGARGVSHVLDAGPDVADRHDLDGTPAARPAFDRDPPNRRRRDDDAERAQDRPANRGPGRRWPHRLSFRPRSIRHESIP